MTAFVLLCLSALGAWAQTAGPDTSKAKAIDDLRPTVLLVSIDAFRPDLILSDIGLPEEDGYALMRAIRSRGRQIPAIALTAYTRPEDKQTALAAGYWHHMAKPIDVTELVTTISAVAAMRGNEKD